MTPDEWPIQRILRGETVHDVEVRVRRRDQDWERIVSYSGAMLETPSGEHMAHLTAYDLTEQRKTEEAFRQSAQQFQDVIDASPELIFVKDLDGRYITVNSTFERVVNMRRGDVRGKTDYDFFPREQADVFRNNDRTVAETGVPLQAEELLDLTDG